MGQAPYFMFSDSKCYLSHLLILDRNTMTVKGYFGLLFKDDEVREFINPDIIKHTIVGSARRRGKLPHLQVNFRNERIETDFLMLATLVTPYKIGEQRGNHITRFHNLLDNIPPCTKDLGRGLCFIGLYLCAECAARALYVVHRISGRQEHEFLSAIWTRHFLHDFSLTSIPCQFISSHDPGIRSC